MKIYAQSIVKFEEKQNEDSYAIHPNLFVLADGAGGFGMFAKEWADTLTQNITTFTSLQDLETQIKTLKIAFYTQQENFLDQHPDYFADKFFNEGSAATLLIADCTELPKIKLFSYGDSGIFVYQTATNTLITNLDENTLSHHPILINCLEPSLYSEKWYQNTVTLQKGDYIILASDAFAHYLRFVYAIEQKEQTLINSLLAQKTAISAKIETYIQHQQDLPSFKQALQNCIQATDSQEKFKDFCYQLYQKKYLDYDDYTLIIIEYTPIIDISQWLEYYHQ